MDARASAELSQGQSQANSIQSNNQVIRDHNTQARQHFQTMTTNLAGAKSSNRHKDEALDSVQSFSDVNDIANFAQARKLAKGQLAVDDSLRGLAMSRGAVPAGSATLRTVADTTGLRTGAEMVRQVPGTIASSGARASQRFGQALGRGASDVAEDAELGVGSIAQKAVGLIGADASRAGAIGDVIGHGIGGVLAGYNAIDDITMSHTDWLKMDPEQRKGNILGIAGGVADVISGAIPILAPIALGLNVASAVEGWMGDKDAQNYTTNRTDLDSDGNPMGLKAQLAASLKKTTTVGPATTSVGLVPQGQTSQIKTQGGAGSF
tara:strand:+ start:944 stop:1909 length:966 start_codon:yes stop_codon:yes gene_type:complete